MNILNCDDILSAHGDNIIKFIIYTIMSLKFLTTA